MASSASEIKAPPSLVAPPPRVGPPAAALPAEAQDRLVSTEHRLQTDRRALDHTAVCGKPVLRDGLPSYDAKNAARQPSRPAACGGRPHALAPGPAAEAQQRIDTRCFEAGPRVYIHPPSRLRLAGELRGFVRGDE